MPDRKKIINLAKDAMADFLYYDRKDDDTVPVGAIEDAIIRGEITAEEIVVTMNLEIMRSVTARKEKTNAS